MNARTSFSEFTGLYELSKLFYEFDIDFNKDIKKQVIEKNTKKLYSSTIYFLNLILQIRNSYSGKSGDENDYINCPRCYFDTRNENEIGIKNGDDNGAYNIARKGIMIIDKIKDWKKDGSKKYPDLYIKIDEYDLKFRKNNF